MRIAVFLALALPMAAQDKQDNTRVVHEELGFILMNPKPTDKEKAWVVEKDVDGFYQGKASTVKHRMEGALIYASVQFCESGKTFGKDTKEVAENHLKGFKDKYKVKEFANAKFDKNPASHLKNGWHLHFEIEGEGGKKTIREWIFFDKLSGEERLSILTCTADDEVFKKYAREILFSVCSFQTFKVKKK